MNPDSIRQNPFMPSAEPVGYAEPRLKTLSYGL